eukprot:gene28544-34456_t
MPAAKVIRKTVPGAHGIGKVNVIYKEKKPKSRVLIFLSLLFYPIFFAIIFISYAWSRPALRFGVLIPMFHKIFAFIDELKFHFSSAQKAAYVNNNGFTVISKPTLQEALFEQGFIHASDRIYQMELYRRLGMGRLSEVLGSRTVYLDSYSRTLNFYETALNDYSGLDSDSKAMLQHYVDGVNAYINKESNLTFPLDFDFTYSPILRAAIPRHLTPSTHNIYTLEPWLPQHSLVVARVWMYLHTGGWEGSLGSLAASIADEHMHLNISKLFLLADSESAEPVLSNSANVPKLKRVDSFANVVVASKKNGKAVLSQTAYSHSYMQGSYYKACLFWGGEEGGGGCGISVPSLPFLFHGRSANLAFSLLPSFSSDYSDSLQLISSTMDVIRRVVDQDGEGEGSSRLVVYSPFLAHRLNVVQGLHAVLTAPNPISLKESKWELGAGYSCVYASKGGEVGAIESSIEPVERIQFTPSSLEVATKESEKEVKVAENSEYDTLLAGHPALLDPLLSLPLSHCSLSALCSSIQGNSVEKNIDKIGSDAFSPSNLFLAHLLQRTWEAEISHYDNHTYSKTIRAFVQALSEYNGQLYPNTVVGSIVEGVRAYLLTHMHTLLYREGERNQHANYFNTYISSLLMPNATALSRMPTADYRSVGLKHALQDLSSSPHLPGLLINATIRTLNWLTDHFPPSPLPSLFTSRAPAVETGLQDKAAWRWGEVAGVLQPHIMEPAGKLQNAVLGRGPDEGQGTLDSIHMHTYSGSLSGAALLFRDDLYAKQHDARVAFRMVVDMSQGDIESLQVTGRYLESMRSHTRIKTLTHAVESMVWDTVRKVLDFVTGTQEFAKTSVFNKQKIEEL